MKFLITQTEQFKVAGVEFFGVIDRTVEEVDD